jgi:hypothetical protein
MLFSLPYSMAPLHTTFHEIRTVATRKLVGPTLGALRKPRANTKGSFERNRQIIPVHQTWYNHGSSINYRLIATVDKFSTRNYIQ